jgi:ankyrin repeat protein
MDVDAFVECCVKGTGLSDLIRVSLPPGSTLHLLDKQARKCVDINQKDDKDTFALQHAAYFGRADIVSALLEHGAESFTWRKIVHPVKHAALERKDYHELVKVKSFICDGLPRAPQHPVNGNCHSYTDDHGWHCDSISLCDACDDDFNRSMLHVAGDAGHLNVVRVVCNFIKRQSLEEQQRNQMLNLPGPTAKGKQTLLMSACKAGKLTMVQSLLDARADCNAVESFHQRTALMLVCLEDHLPRKIPIVQALLDANADIEARDALGMSAYHYAVRAGRVRLVDHCFSDAVIANLPEVLSAAILWAPERMLTWLGDEVADLNHHGRNIVHGDSCIERYRDCAGRNMMHLIFSRQGDEEVASTTISLFRHGLVDRLLSQSDVLGFTPLMALCGTATQRHTAQVNTLKLVLQNSIDCLDINATNNQGRTALMLACGRSDLCAPAHHEDGNDGTDSDITGVNIVLALLRANADVLARDEIGWDALMHACSQQNTRLAKWLFFKSEFSLFKHMPSS